MTSDLDHLHDYFLSLGFAAQPSTYRKAATVTSTQRAYRTPPSPPRPTAGGLRLVVLPLKVPSGEGVCLGGPWSLPATPTPASPYSCSLSCSIRLLIKLTRASRYPVWEGLSG